EARPVGRMAHLARWCRHNPMLAGLVGAAALLFAGLAVASFLLWQERDRVRQALEREEEQARQARASAAEAEAGRARLQDNLETAFAMMDITVHDFRKKNWRGREGIEDARRHVAARAIDVLERYIRRDEGELKYARACAQAYSHLATIWAAID